MNPYKHLVLFPDERMNRLTDERINGYLSSG